METDVLRRARPSFLDVPGSAKVHFTGFTLPLELVDNSEMTLDRMGRYVLIPGQA
jgi:hypothetical protein